MTSKWWSTIEVYFSKAFNHSARKYNVLVWIVTMQQVLH